MTRDSSVWSAYGPAHRRSRKCPHDERDCATGELEIIPPDQGPFAPRGAFPYRTWEKWTQRERQSPFEASYARTPLFPPPRDTHARMTSRTRERDAVMAHA